MWNKMFRTDLFDGVHFLTDKAVDDMSVMHFLVDKCNRIAVVNSPQNHYIKHRGSMISSRNYKMRLDIMELIMLQHQYVLSRYPELCKDMSENIYHGYISLCVASVLEKREERKKYEGVRTLVDEYFKKFEDDFKKELNVWKYNNLIRIWKNSMITDYFVLVVEMIHRMLAGRGLRKI